MENKTYLLIETLDKYLKLNSSDGKPRRRELRTILGKQLQDFKDGEYNRKLAESILYKSLKDVKTYLKCQELEGHVPILRRHQKIMAEIESGMKQGKVLFNG